MKRTTRLIGASLLAAAAGTGMVWAQSATQEVNLSATVTAFCKFNTVSVPGGSTVNMSVDSTGTSASVLHVTNPINTTTGNLNAASFQMVLGSVCNSASRVALTTTSGGLTPSAAPTINPGSAAAFATRIDYTASATWPNSSGASLTTSGIPGDTVTSTNATGPRAQNLTMTFTLDANPTTIVAAGSYSDVLRITLEPQ